MKKQRLIDEHLKYNIDRIIRKIETETQKNQEPGNFRLIPNQQSTERIFSVLKLNADGSGRLLF